MVPTEHDTRVVLFATRVFVFEKVGGTWVGKHETITSERAERIRELLRVSQRESAMTYPTSSP